ncbi:TIGR01777 family oxidoreductase [Pseudalkalibacillus caeni]|uniref:TIGR01777 family protein n=1 Tax=Exobacillus caeni TaxID=2574798 RepID=A0A5R9F7G5_9BACL|nr:TIGR01777 family oxidoreductase [Pseudalkalibacillus caeni]TLS35715.1 TIGR01777 family protein [Pseudalkalibacillus caeni]
MKVAITGGSGFVGSALTDSLRDEGHEVIILTRNSKGKTPRKGVTYVEWLNGHHTPEKALEGLDAFVNLAGEPINSGRWTSERKQRILNSRIDATREVVSIISNLEKKPEVLVNASAIGCYGTSKSRSFTEDSDNRGDDFLARVVQQWEKEAGKAQALGVRTVYCRFGLILGKEDGALPRLVIPYKLFAGGPLGDGMQWYSWVHIDDVVGMIRFAMENEAITGPLNVTAPEPKRMKDFGKTLADVLGRPHWLPAPSVALKLALGEMSVLVLEGQCVLPLKAKENGFPFKFSHAKEALENLLGS